jgi:8-oxo-dGTP pyrophosphatase MutT (NUDIX family)
MQIELLARGVLVHEEHVLLVKNIRKQHMFLPGGHIEFAESARAALVREIKEELGVTISIDRFLGAAEHRWKEKKHTHAEINLLFIMHCPSLESSSAPVSLETKIAFIWHPLSDLVSVNFQPAVLRTLLPKWTKNDLRTCWASSFEQPD